MDDKSFEELIDSVREGGKILRGEKPPARQFTIDPPDVKAIRKNYQLTQRQFADLLGIKIKTLQNWEQGRRKPQGAARILLHIAEKNPKTVFNVIAPLIYQVS